jgi:hypothetical protein
VSRRRRCVVRTAAARAPGRRGAGPELDAPTGEHQYVTPPTPIKLIVTLSFQSAMPVGHADTPASDGLLAATLQALGDDGYRSEVDAGVLPR